MRKVFLNRSFQKYAAPRIEGLESLEGIFGNILAYPGISMHAAEYPGTWKNAQSILDKLRTSIVSPEKHLKLDCSRKKFLKSR